VQRLDHDDHDDDHDHDDHGLMPFLVGLLFLLVGCTTDPATLSGNCGATSTTTTLPATAEGR
jgi:hypothetical protein